MPCLAEQLALAVDIDTTGSITIGDTADDEDERGAIGTEVRSSQRFTSISPVDVRIYSQFLKEPNIAKPITGAVPKILKNTTLFEKWRSETENLRKCKELESERKKENEIRRKRELQLANQLKQLEIQNRDDLQVQRAREADLKAQLQQLERNQALIEEQKHQELTALQDELQRLRAVEQQFLKHSQQQHTGGYIGVLKSDPIELLQGNHQQPTSDEQPERTVYEQPAQMIHEQPTSQHTANVSNYPAPHCTIMPPMSFINVIPNNLQNASINTSPSYPRYSFNENYSPSPIHTPVGGRSHYNVPVSPPIVPPMLCLVYKVNVRFQIRL